MVRVIETKAEATASKVEAQRAYFDALDDKERIVRMKLAHAKAELDSLRFQREVAVAQAAGWWGS